MMDQVVLNLQQRILAVIARGVATPSSDEEFDRLARQVFAFQYEHCAPYRAYCEHLKRLPVSISHWKEIPAVPAGAFKDFALTCFPVGEAVAEFHTSGTTREKAGKHYLRTLELYEAAIRPNFAEQLMRDCLTDDGKRDARPAKEGARLPMMVLTPSPQEAPHSSLSHMMGVVMREFGADESAYYVEGEQLLAEKLVRDLCEAQWAHQPAFLLGTAFAFVHLFDHLAQQNLRFEMPEGSRVMETGGFKGRAREMSKSELYTLFERFLGIPKAWVVNEYGMTELSTQFYDETLAIGRQTDGKMVPPWARVLIIDPNTGREAAFGERGLIRVFDLANLGSIMCLQTEDLGVLRSRDDDGKRDARPTMAEVQPYGFEVLGRATGAEVRGCSLNAETLRTSQSKA
jgi:Acyl-protein synthetase, LuxE